MVVETDVMSNGSQATTITIAIAHLIDPGIIENF